MVEPLILKPKKETCPKLILDSYPDKAILTTHQNRRVNLSLVKWIDKTEYGPVTSDRDQPGCFNYCIQFFFDDKTSIWWHFETWNERDDCFFEIDRKSATILV